MPLPIDFSTFELVHVLAYGTHITRGRTALWAFQGTRKACIIILCEGECSQIRKVFFNGFQIAEFDANNNRNWKFHPGTLSTGFDDAVQGRPFLFPFLDWTGSGTCWIEVLLPEEFSSDQNEPSGFHFLLNTRVVDIYDASGSSQGREFSANNFDVIADLMKNFLKIPYFLQRNDWESWRACRAYAAETISSSQGRGLSGIYYPNHTFSAAVATRPDPIIDFYWPDGSPHLEIVPGTPFCVRWEGSLTPQFSETYTLRVECVGAARIYINGTLLASQWLLDYNYELRIIEANIAFTANTPYTLKIEFRQVGQAQVSLYWESASRPLQIVPQDRFGTNNVDVPRFESHIVAASPTDAVNLIYAALALAPGCGWQEKYGKIYWYTGQPKDSSHTFRYTNDSDGQRTNITDEMSVFRTLRSSRVNQFRFAFRNLSDDILREARVLRARDALRDKQGGVIIDNGERSLGTCTPSHALRTAEYIARVETDLSYYWHQIADASSSHLRVGDEVIGINVIPGFTDGLTRFQIIKREELDENTSPDFVKFEMQEWRESVYSDTPEGSIASPLVPGYINHLAIPPRITACSLTQSVIQSPQGGYSISINASVTFGVYQYSQFARVFVKAPGSGSFVLVDNLIVQRSSSGLGAFSIPNCVSGVYELKVVTYNSAGVTSGVAQAVIYSLDVAPIAATLYKVVETMAVEESQLTPGLIFGASKDTSVSASLWFGAEVWKSYDNVTYSKVLDVTESATIGYMVNAMNSGGDNLSVVGTFDFGTNDATALKIQLIGEKISLTDATQNQVRAGANSCLIGNESCGFRLLTGISTGRYSVAEVLRGKNLTDHEVDNHSVNEPFILLDEFSRFINLAEEEAGATLYFKVFSKGQALPGSPTFTFAVQGTTVKPAMPLDFEAVNTGDYDWYFSFRGRARQRELPAFFAIDIRKLDNTFLRTLDCLENFLRPVVFITSEADFQETFDPLFGLSVRSVTRTNVSTITAGNGGTTFIALSPLSSSYSRFDFTLRYVGGNVPDIILEEVGGFGLCHESAPTIYNRDWNTFILAFECDVLYNSTTLADDLEVKILRFGVNAGSVAYSNAEATAGIRFTVILQLGEYRIYENYRSGAFPLVTLVAPSSGHNFPLYFAGLLFPSLRIDEAVIDGNNLPSVVYTREQQELDNNGVALVDLKVDAYQKRNSSFVPKGILYSATLESTLTAPSGSSNPYVLSINRASGYAEANSTGNVKWRITFSEAVTGVNVGLFTNTVVSGSLTGYFLDVLDVISSTVYDVYVSDTLEHGVLRLNLPATNSIIDGNSNALITSFTTGQTFNVDVSENEALAGTSSGVASNSASLSSLKNLIAVTSGAASNSADLTITSPSSSLTESFVEYPTTSTRTDNHCPGFKFRVLAEITVKELGRFYNTGNSENHEIGIWNSGGTLLRSATILAASSSDANNLKWVAITDLDLLTGADYTIGVRENGDDTWKDFWNVNLQPIFTNIASVYNGDSFSHPTIVAGANSMYSTPAMKYQITGGSPQTILNPDFSATDYGSGANYLDGTVDNWNYPTASAAGVFRSSSLQFGFMDGAGAIIRQYVAFEAGNYKVRLKVRSQYTDFYPLLRIKVNETQVGSDYTTTSSSFTTIDSASFTVGAGSFFVEFSYIGSYNYHLYIDDVEIIAA